MPDVRIVPDPTPGGPVVSDPDPDVAVRADVPEVVVTIPASEPPESEPLDVPQPVAAPPSPAGPPHKAIPAQRRALMPWAVVAATLVILGAVGIGLTYTPVFHAKTIDVTGEHRLSEQRILKIAGIGPATDVFHLDLGAVERHLERNPWIAVAVVTRRLPSTITVKVSERRPIALTRTPDGRLAYMAVDGTVLAPAPARTPLPEVVTAATSTDDAAALSAGAVVARGLPRSLVPQVASISVDDSGAVTVLMRSGVTAAYGDASEPEAKGQALKAVLDYASTQPQAIVSINLEVPGAPTAVFAGGVVVSPNHRV